MIGLRNRVHMFTHPKNKDNFLFSDTRWSSNENKTSLNMMKLAVFPVSSGKA